jgi:hypothetical protein
MHLFLSLLSTHHVYLKGRDSITRYFTPFFHQPSPSGLLTSVLEDFKFWRILRRLAGAANTNESGLSKTHLFGYTTESGHADVANTGESLIQPSRLLMLLMEQFLKKQTARVQYRLIGRVSCFKICSNFTHSDLLPSVADTGKSTKNANNLTNFWKKSKSFYIPITGLENLD